MPPRYKQPAGDITQSLLKAFGNRLKDLRQKQDRSRVELAKKVGCSSAMLGRYERGENFPTGLHLVQLAHELEVTLDYLVTGFGHAKNKLLLQRFRSLEKLPAEKVEQAITFIDLFLGDNQTQRRA